MSTSIAQKLKIIQKATGQSQAAVAQMFSVSTQTLNSWINGNSTPRKKAQERIDARYHEYTGDTTVAADILSEKRARLTALHAQHHDPLSTLLKRRDLYEQLLLEMTYHTNSIEGSTFNEPEVRAVLFDDVTIPKRSVLEHQEVKNHQGALGHIMRMLRECHAIDEAAMRRIHEILMNGILYNAGVYRTHSVRITGSHVTTVNPAKIEEVMRDFVRSYMTKPKNIVVHIAKHHAWFEQIHPFSDGNGRTGRLLALATALVHGYAPPLIKKERKIAYYNCLEEAQLNGNYVPLESFMYDAMFEGYRLLDAK